MTHVPMLLAAVGLAMTACGDAGSPTPVASGRTPVLVKLRVAVLAAETTSCAADSPNWPIAQKAYRAHLAGRMGIPVTLCPMAGHGAVASALADGSIDLGLLDQAALGPVREAVRPIFAERPHTLPGRVVVELVTLDTAAPQRLADLLPRYAKAPPRLIMSRENADMLAGVQATLAGAGFARASLDNGVEHQDAAAAAAALRRGAGDVLAIGAAEWFRYCRGSRKDETPCAGLRTIWKGRAPVPVAWAVRRNMAAESWARLVGIHIALPLERPDVAAWLVPGAREITPVEATALEPAA